MNPLPVLAATVLAASVLIAAPAHAVKGASDCDTFKSGVVSGHGQICLAAVWNVQADGHGTRVHSINFWSPDADELDGDPALDYRPLSIKTSEGVQRWSVSGSLTRQETYIGYSKSWPASAPMLISTRVGFVCAAWKAHVNNAPDDSGSFCVRIE